MSRTNQSIVAALIVVGAVGAVFGVRNAMERNEASTPPSDQPRLTFLPSVQEVHTVNEVAPAVLNSPNEEDVRQAEELSLPAPASLTSGEMRREVAAPEIAAPIVPVAAPPIDSAESTIGDAAPPNGVPLSALPPEPARASIDPALLDRQIAAQQQQLEWIALEIMGASNPAAKALLIVSYNNLSAQLGEALSLRNSLADAGL